MKKPRISTVLLSIILLVLLSPVIIMLFFWRSETLLKNSTLIANQPIVLNDKVWALNTKPYMVVKGNFNCPIGQMDFMIKTDIIFNDDSRMGLHSEPKSCQNANNQNIKLYNHDSIKEYLFKRVKNLTLVSTANGNNITVNLTNASP